MVWLTERAPAKVNLTLHVTGRAPNGYHWLDSLVVFGPAADILHASPASGLALALRGPFADGLLAEPDNLVLRAARALAAWAGRAADASLVLEKHLPVASGIGGGSADAAAALRVLARLWAVDVPPGDMAALAAGLGADVPVCLAGRPTRMAGIGDALSPAPRLPPCGLLLVNPGVALSTADVFRARTGVFSAAADFPESWPDAASMVRDLAGLRNDLEAAARGICPPVGEALAALRALPGCLLARMSGSGATCFGLFTDPAAAARAATSVPAGWWRCAGGMGT